MIGAGDRFFLDSIFLTFVHILKFATDTTQPLSDLTDR